MKIIPFSLILYTATKFGQTRIQVMEEIIKSYEQGEKNRYGIVIEDESMIDNLRAQVEANKPSRGQNGVKKVELATKSPQQGEKTLRERVVVQPNNSEKPFGLFQEERQKRENEFINSINRLIEKSKTKELEPEEEELLRFAYEYTNEFSTLLNMETDRQVLKARGQRGHFPSIAENDVLNYSRLLDITDRMNERKKKKNLPTEGRTIEEFFKGILGDKTLESFLTGYKGNRIPIFIIMARGAKLGVKINRDQIDEGQKQPDQK